MLFRKKETMPKDINDILKINKILNIINLGLYPKKYDDWAKHPDPTVRYTLVCNGFKPELFIHDDNHMIRSEALKLRPDLQKESLQDIIDDPTKLEFVDNVLNKQFYIDIELLTKHISNLKNYKQISIYDPLFNCESYEVKLKAMQTELSSEEKQMSSYELYKIGNPGWAHDFNVQSIGCILEMSEFTDEDDDDFKRIFTPEIEPKGGKIVIGQIQKRIENNKKRIKYNANNI